MVQLMGSSGKKPGVKLEVDDSLHNNNNRLPPLRKRSRPDPSLLQGGDSVGGGEVEVIFSPSTCNPLEEPCPLGLSLKKSPSFLELIQMKLSQANAKRLAASSKKKDVKGSSVPGAADKLKASNFPASLLKIGSWEYKSKYEGDLVAKCYFAKHKLVWEVLDGGLKNKIEIQWSDIVDIKANCSEDRPETLDVVLARQPLFFRETNPQPRKHTLWQATTDFTGGQASIQRRHFLQCQQGLLGRHFEKLILCDPRLNFLSKQPDIVLESSYFKSPEFDDSGDLSHGVELGRQRPSIFDFPDPSSPSAYQSSSCVLEDAGRSSANFCDGSSSTSSRAGSHAIGDLIDSGTGEGKLFSSCDQIKFPGVHPSMSMSDLVNHIGNCISDGIASLPLPAGEKQLHGKELLEDITQYLLGDSQQAPASEEVLMSRVNSLCCLLQKDSVSTPKSLGREEGEGEASNGDKMCTRRIKSSPGNGGNETAVHMWKYSAATGKYIEKDAINHETATTGAGNRAMLRKDSVGELLLNLPRIASLPRFRFDISECEKMCM